MGVRNTRGYKMNGTKFFVIVTSLFFAPIGVTQANDTTDGTGNNLIKFCNQKTSEAQNSDWAYCVAYIDGVTDGYVWSGLLIHGLIDGEPTKDGKRTLSGVFELLKNEFCLPNNVTRQQMALVVSKYLADNPALLNQPSSDLVIGAVAKAWPCAKSQ